MPITVGTGPGEYPATVQYVVNGEPADDITFNRPTEDLASRTDAMKACLDAFPISEVVGLEAALQGAAPLHANLGTFTLLDYNSNIGSIFVIGAGGQVELIPNTLQGEVNTAANQGAGSQVFQTKAGVELRFRTLVAGTNVTLNQSADEIEIVSAPGEINYLSKVVKNSTGATIPAFKAVAWKDDGTVALADANIMALSDFCGITMAPINHGDFGLVAKYGNVPGVLAGLGALPGRYVYLGETPGDIVLTQPPGLTDTILALGRAEPPDNVATAAANDLWLHPSYLTEGGA